MTKPARRTSSRALRARQSSRPPQGGDMAIEYLLVTYPEERAVLADGHRVGFTNHTFMLPTDEYLITLEGSGYAPPKQDVPLSGTSLVKPMVISFSPLAQPGGAPPPFPPPSPPRPPLLPPPGPRARRKRMLRPAAWLVACL